MVLYTRHPLRLLSSSAALRVFLFLDLAQRQLGVSAAIAAAAAALGRRGLGLDGGLGGGSRGRRGWSLHAKPVRPGDPAAVSVHRGWERWDVGWSLPALAPCLSPPLALQLQTPHERPPLREALPRDSIIAKPVGPQEVQPLSRYVFSGLVGISEGRCPLLLHSLHPS